MFVNNSIFNNDIFKIDISLEFNNLHGALQKW